MYECGKIVLIAFPFTDLTSSKLRPALIISKTNKHSADIIVCFITTKNENSKKLAMIQSSSETGLKVDSFVRFDKIATLDKKIVIGELGEVKNNFFKNNQNSFYGIFGFSN